MDTKSIEDLGFLEVRSHIESHALSAEGREGIRSLPFLSDRQALQLRQHMVGCIRSLLQNAKDGRPGTFPDIGASLVTLDDPVSTVGGIALRDIASYIASADRLRSFLARIPEDLPAADEVSAMLGDGIEAPLLALQVAVEKALDASGQVREDHPAIIRLRGQLEQVRTRRSRFSRSFMQEHQGSMQGDGAAYRDGRLVLPVRNDRRSEIQGFVGSSSSSGNTVFMEPYPLVEMNNDVVMAENKILVEIARIVGDLERQARSVLPALHRLVAAVAKVDVLFAIADYTLAERWNAVDLEHDRCRLLEARHPLLGSDAVPVTVDLDSDMKAVVITGPNAGGKTVTIKMVGLFALLHQFCAYLPVAEGSALPLFDAVYTDIGDDQSIEEHLSTFSGHMKRIAEILDSMDRRSLVILDELGSGTDPVEGAAIARSVLEYCIDHASLSLVTSHHGVLKQFAYARKEVINASMEFDPQTHLPTFHLINGIPGESHAVDTARAMHLPREVVDRAQRYLGDEALRIGEIIRNLEKRQQEAEQNEREMAERMQAIQEKSRQADLRELRLRQRELQLKDEQATQLYRFMKQKNSELEQLVAELREGEITREKTRKVKDYVASLEERNRRTEEEIAQDRAALEQAVPEDAGTAVPFSVGMDVLCGSAKREGKILRKAGKGRWVVAIGTMKFTLSEKDLAPAKRTEGEVRVVYDGETPRPKLTLDVRGLTLEETLAALDSQIESALVYGMETFSIIHGFGDGILSRGVGEYLDRHPRVTGHRFAAPEDGGGGKTYVTL